MKDGTTDGAAALPTATDIRAGMQAGNLSAIDVTRASLRRIAERDKDVRAWIAISDSAIAAAAEIDGDDTRPLAGVPVGIKDIIDTHDMPTTHNSPLFAGHRPTRDAPCVAILRNLGAIILGKTDTTEFAAAGRDAVTANPVDLTRTAGGSSAGSAAAVADGHVPLALGTQTGGSTIRPGSFNGVYAFKPSWGLVSTEGVKRYSVSFDTVGWYARTPEDLTLLAAAYSLPGVGTAAPEAPRMAICRTPYADQLAPESARALDRFAEKHALEEIVLPDRFKALDDLHRLVMWTEGAAAFRALTLSHPDLLHADFHDRVALRDGQTPRAMFEAYDMLAELRVAFERLIGDLDALVVPSAPGYAIEGRSPGNPIFNALWTAMQMPVVNIPVTAADDPLPIGVSLVGPRASDGALLSLATALSRTG
jgi:Asp-tRNA(Asn)/Glu-tRNA(Gln) amidotransferase A subunit family amidase